LFWVCVNLLAVSTLRSIHACAALFIAFALPQVALAAPTREACVDAYEQSQVAIKRGELSKGRDLVRVCLDSACPPRLQADCATWLTEIETKQPTIVVSYRDRRNVQRTDVEVFVDGKSVATKLDGRGIAVEPGAHTVRIQPADDQPMEEKRVVREGVKLDPVEFSRAVKAPPTRIVLPPERPIPTMAFVAGGVGVLGFAGFTTFAILGKTAQNELDNTCVTNCTDVEVSKVRSRYLVADISLAVGVVGLTSAVLLKLKLHPLMGTANRLDQLRRCLQLQRFVQPGGWRKPAGGGHPMCKLFQAEGCSACRVRGHECADSGWSVCPL
jgi:hypothetical protein